MGTEQNTSAEVVTLPGSNVSFLRVNREIPILRGTSIGRQVILGEVLADAYAAAQEGTAMEVSDAICDLMQNATNWVKLGFNSRMKNYPYNVKA